MEVKSINNIINRIYKIKYMMILLNKYYYKLIMVKLMKKRYKN